VPADPERAGYTKVYSIIRLLFLKPRTDLTLDFKMASPMEVYNASQTSLPDTMHATISSSQSGIMSKVLENTGVWSVLFTVLAIAVAYDQSMCSEIETLRLLLTVGL